LNIVLTLENLPTVNFPFICVNVTVALAYGVYISQV